MIELALAFCDNDGSYSRHAAVTIASILSNTGSPVRFNVLHDSTLTPENREKLHELCSRYDQTINFIDIGGLIDKNSPDIKKICDSGFLGTLFRLLIPSVIQAGKVIYLDCDVIVNMDIAELWNIDVNNYPLAAVLDVWSLNYLRKIPVPWRLRKVWQLLNIPLDRYFNAGVLLLNLNMMRIGGSLVEKMKIFFKHYNKCITLADQDFLNHAYSRDFLVLDEKFNKIEYSKGNNKNVKNCIWHLAGGAKPWVSYTRPDIDELYWQYLADTPFCTSRDELIRLMLKGLSSPKYAHYHSSACIHKIMKQLRENLTKGHIFTLPYLLFEYMKTDRQTDRQ